MFKIKTVQQTKLIKRSTIKPINVKDKKQKKKYTL